MSSVVLVGDSNTGGGVATSTLQGNLRVNGVDAVVDGSPVSNHGSGPHAAAVTANGKSKFRINGVPVNVDGNADTCGDTRSSSNNFRIT